MVIHAVQIPYVVLTIIKQFVHVCPIILADRQIVGPNVLWIQIVQQRWLVYVINVRVHVMEHADQMHIAPFSITRPIVFVMMDSLAIHTADAAKLLSVRFRFEIVLLI